MKNNIVRKSKFYGLSLMTGMFLLLASVVFSQERAAKKERQPENCQPAVRMSSLLDAVKVNGTLQIGELYVECLPMPALNAGKYIYEPYQGAKFTSVLKDSRGEIVNSFVWYGEKFFTNVVKMSRYEIVGGAGALRELTPGDYALHFAVDGDVFQTFRFSVATKKSGDLYRPGVIYLIDGAWRDEAALTSPTVEDIMCFNFRLRADYALADLKPVKVPFEVTMVRDEDARLVAANRDPTLILESTWKTYRTCFVRPANEAAQKYSTLKLKEIFAVDGRYTVNLSFDGKPYATYKFNVRKGKINGDELPARNIRVVMPANILRR